MNLIETYNGSGFYAQYADSASYDANGTPLTSYLTAVPAGQKLLLLVGQSYH